MIPVGRRIAAARELAGYTSVEKFAKHLAAEGFSASTLRNYESGRDTPAEGKVRQFARLVGLPYAFFTIDYAVLETDVDDARTTSLEQRVARVETAITLLADPDLRDEDRRQALERWRQQGESRPARTAPEPPNEAAT